MALFGLRPVIENIVRLLRLIRSQIRPIRSNQLNANMRNWDSKRNGFHEWEWDFEPHHFLPTTTKEPLWLRNFRRYNEKEIKEIEEIERRNRESKNANEDSEEDSEVELRPSAYKRELKLEIQRREQEHQARRRQELEAIKKRRRENKLRQQYDIFWKKSGFGPDKENAPFEEENIPFSQQATQPRQPRKRQRLSIN